MSDSAIPWTTAGQTPRSMDSSGESAEWVAISFSTFPGGGSQLHESTKELVLD